MAGNDRPFDLRPLGIGEIFDRAVTIYVQNFLVFAAILLAVFLPLGCAEYFFFGNAAQITDMAKILAPSMTAAQVGLFAAYAVWGFALLPLGNMAVASGVAALYVGKRPDVRSCYATALRGWLRVIGFMLLMGIVAAALLAVLFLLIVVVNVLITILGAVAGGAAIGLTIVVEVVIGIFSVFLILSGILIAVLIGAFGSYAIAIERTEPVKALSSAVARIFNRREFGRALLMLLSWLLFQIGADVASFAAATLVLLVLHSMVLYVALGIAIDIAVGGFSTVLLAVYYYDVRVRREGLDLEARLQQLSEAPASA